MTQRLGRAARRVVSRRRILMSDLAVGAAGTMVMIRLFDTAGVLPPARARQLAVELLDAAQAAADAGG